MRTDSKQEEARDPRNSETNLWKQWKEIIGWRAANLESHTFKLENKV